VTQKLTSEVELDETFVGGKNKNRHWNQKAKKKQSKRMPIEDMPQEFLNDERDKRHL